MFKFLHTADIHLDSPLLNLDRYDGAPLEVFRSATRRALDNVVQLAIDEQVQFVVIAGDLYDGDCRDFSTPLHFRRKMDELREHDIRVLVCQGNHDAQSGMRKAFRLQLPENVHLFRTDRPETVRIDSLQVAVHGQGFAQKAVEADLSQGYPEPVPGWLNIGVLHTSCGPCEAHDTYAPSSVMGLTAKGYQYWALGHIHKSERLAGPEPWIIYPGNTQGRHIREEGPKGCVVATVSDGRINVDWRAVDVLRWRRCAVDASECEEAETVVEAAREGIAQLLEESDGRPLAVRIEVTGATPAHRALARHGDHWDRQLRVAMVDHFDDRVWVEKIKFRTQPAAASTGMKDWDGPLAQLVGRIDDGAAARAALDDVRNDIELLLKLLPSDPRLDEERIDLDDQRQRAALLHDAKELLISRLLDSGEPA